MIAILEMILSVLTKPEKKFFPVVDTQKELKFFPLMTEREILLENRRKGILGNGKCAEEDF